MGALRGDVGVAGTKLYRDLIVWQRSIQLVKNVYEITRTFPSDERFGLVSQMRRAAVSIASNIAEGQARRTPGEFIQFLSRRRIDSRTRHSVFHRV